MESPCWHSIEYAPYAKYALSGIAPSTTTHGGGRRETRGTGDNDSIMFTPMDCSRLGNHSDTYLETLGEILPGIGDKDEFQYKALGNGL